MVSFKNYLNNTNNINESSDSKFRIDTHGDGYVEKSDIGSEYDNTKVHMKVLEGWLEQYVGKISVNAGTLYELDHELNTFDVIVGKDVSVKIASYSYNGSQSIKVDVDGKRIVSSTKSMTLEGLSDVDAKKIVKEILKQIIKSI